jgi:hypothetical protein
MLVITAATVLGFGLAALRGSSALAAPGVPLPPVDLGETNILDGEGAPGFLLEFITQGYGADRLAGADGRAAPGSNQQQIAGEIIHPIFESNATFLGAHPGVEVFLPFTYIHNQFAGGGSGSDTGLGDLTVSPFLQWSPPNPGAGAVSMRFGLHVVAPTGEFRSNAAVNTGNGAWQVSPYFAASWRVSERWELSARAIYGWSGSADTRLMATEPARMQAGDLFALNASASYAATSTWRVGVGGYLLRQLDASTFDGVSLPANLQRVYGLGPVSSLQLGRVSLLVAAYGEFAAQNRPQGFSFNMRLQYPF